MQVGRTGERASFGRALPRAAEGVSALEGGLRLEVHEVTPPPC